MGNIAISCAPSTIISRSTGGDKDRSGRGNRKEVQPWRRRRRAVKAAEIMLENPGSFVCDAGALKVGQRIRGLSADEELRKRRLYLLLPMDLLYSVLTHEEMTSFTSNKIKNKNKNKNKNNCLSNYFGNKYIFSSLAEFCMFLLPNNNNNIINNKSESSSSLGIISSSLVNFNNNNNNSEESSDQPGLLYSKQRSWRPALETILETPAASICR